MEVLERPQQTVRNQGAVYLYEDTGGGVWAAFENKPIFYGVARLVLTEPICAFCLQGKNSVSETQKIIQKSTALSLPFLSSGYYQLRFSINPQHYLIQSLVLPRIVFQLQTWQHHNKNMWANAQCLNTLYKFIQVFFAMMNDVRKSIRSKR
ncbi:hypothetical protein BKK49_11220 [Rodentibacter rarus]|uniref:Uncharacterized protein n=1 Tax=Rodentibacter rarus TaxID=1908260 RepID=A0A1V3IEX6_9PAST|nr:hypothetical protein BKK49_11220 [Rodentibacter rarus]OOF39284.1 hypothetical protein BKK50_10845 [Rodentibacter rarus]